MQQLPLELGIIAFCRASLSPVKHTQAPTATDDPQIPVSSQGFRDISDLRKQVGNMQKTKAMYGEPTKKASLKKELSVDEDSAKTSVSLLHASIEGELNKEWMQNLWNNIISEMKIYNHTIAGVLRGCSIGSYDKKTLVIASSYKFHKERLDDIKVKNELSRITKMLTGKDVSVVVELRNNN